MIKVLLLAPQKAVGGISTWASLFVKYIDRQRFKICLIDTSRLYMKPGQATGAREIILGLVYAFVRFFHISWFYKKQKPRIIYFTCSPSTGYWLRDLLFLLFFSFFKVKTVIHLHGGKVSGYFGKTILGRFWSKFVLNRSSAVIVITRQIETAAKKIINPSKVYYIPNMLDKDWLVRFSDDKPITEFSATKPAYLVHIAWQAPEKGTFDLIETLKYVQTPFKCELIGECHSNVKNLISARIQSLELSNKLRYVGLKTRDEIAHILRQADLLIFPSHSEGFPMVILETMAAGVPIIATDVGNIREMICYDTVEQAGWIVDYPVNHLRLSEKVDLLLSDITTRKKMSINGKRIVREKYLPDKVVPQLTQILLQI